MHPGQRSPRRAPERPGFRAGTGRAAIRPLRWLRTSYVEIVYPAVGLAARGVFGALGLRVHVEGEENVPRAGAFVLVSNHASYLDFALVGRRRRAAGGGCGSWPGTSCGARGWWAPRCVGCGTCRWTGPRRPRRTSLPGPSCARARRWGSSRRPGSSTSYTVRALMPGAVALAQATGVPVVPMAVWGTQRILTAGRPLDLTRGRPVSLLVGAPMAFAPSWSRRRRPLADRGAGPAPAVPARRAAGPTGAPAATRGAARLWRPVHLWRQRSRHTCGGAAPARASVRSRLDSGPCPKRRSRSSRRSGSGSRRTEC